MGKNRKKNLRKLPLDGIDYSWLAEKGATDEDVNFRRLSIWQGKKKIYHNEVSCGAVTPATVVDIIRGLSE